MVNNNNIEFKERNGRAWPQFIRLASETSGELLWTRYYTLGFHNMREIFWVAEELPSFMELASTMCSKRWSSPCSLSGRHKRRIEIYHYYFSNLGAGLGWAVNATTRPFYPQGINWAPEPVWTGTENRAPTGIQSPDRPARSESLYRLRYVCQPHNV